MSDRILYLHGFASGPASKKARLFAERLPQVEVPDLVDSGFANLTIGGQLRVIEATARGEAVSLVGSSMGGYLAALYASRHPEVRRVVLLAPAFRFAERWAEMLGAEGVRNWRESGGLPVLHYGYGRQERVGWQLMEEAAAYEAEPVFLQPGLIFHGVHDEVVPVEFSRAYAARHGNILYREVDSGHELMDGIGEIVAESVRFLAE